MEKITVILPIHKLGEKEKDYFFNAIESVGTQVSETKPKCLVVVSDEELKKEIESLEYKEGIKDTFKVIVNTGESDFCSQINFGVDNIDTEWFSILEVDDEYSKIWFKKVNEYMSHYSDVEVFLPLVLDVSPEGKFLHFTNEPVWAPEFSDKLGFLDNDSLLNFPNFQTSGGVYKKEAFKSVGGFKSKVKLHFVYEFLLRMTYYDKTIMTIPKLGYKKTNMRENSLFYDYYNGVDRIDPLEAKWWFNTAKKECYFKQDRGITYEVEETV
tara:strand:- start:37644 stop:38450 length:807 start_codon:yes stop_codon:yes gene_type:complete